MQERLPVDIASLGLSPEQNRAIDIIHSGVAQKTAFNLNWVEYVLEKTSTGFFFVNAWTLALKKVWYITNYSSFHDSIEVTALHLRKSWIGRALLQTKIALAWILPYETTARWDQMVLLVKFWYVPIATVNNFKVEHTSTSPIDDMIESVQWDRSHESETLDMWPYRLQYNPEAARRFAQALGILFDPQKVPRLKE